MREVAEGVRYIHSQGIVHSDLRGVGNFISHFVRQFIPLSARKTFFSTMLSTAKSLMLGLHDLLMLARY